VVDSELTALLEEALELVGPKDSAQRVRLMSRLARAIYWSPDDQRRRALVDESIAIARRIEDPAVLAFALGNCIAAKRSPDTAEEELAWIDEVLALPEAPVELVVLARNVEIDLLLERGILGAADAAIDALERLSQQLRDVRARPYAHVHRARRAVMQGRWADAERSIDEADQAAATLDDSTFPLTVGGVRFVLALARGRPADLEPELRQLATNLPTMPVWEAGLAWIHASKGEQHEASRLLERLAADDLSKIPRDNMWPITIGLLAQSCAEIGDSGHARQLYDALVPFRQLVTISPVAGYLGPVARLLGLLAETFDDRASAERHLRAALELARRQRALPMISTIAVDLARVVGAGEASARSDAHELLAEAERIARELDMPAVIQRASVVADSLSHRAHGEPRDQDGHVSPSEAAVEPLAATAKREGEVWSFEFDGRTIRVRDSKGVRLLAELLSNPGLELDALQLDRGADAAPASSVRAAMPAELSVDDPGTGAGPALDETAKSAYRRRLDDLREELDEAERWGDPERIARAREEIDFIARELSSAVGLGGRDRPQAAAAERARVNVTRAVKTAIRRLSEQDVALGAELRATVHTGRFCTYRPDPRRPIGWGVDAG
jgi:hypothetical protein